jgi:hypothetical protein
MTRRDSARPSTPRLLLAVATGLLLLSLDSCNGDHRQEALAQAFGYHCNVHNSKTANTVCGKNSADGGTVSRYCYKSLASANCFDRPDPYNKDQLGSSGY